jgi:hypothetical protein
MPFTSAGNLHYLAGLQTGSTDFDSFYSPVDIRPDRLKIRIPAPFYHIVSVRNRISEIRLLSAYFTNFCHFYSPDLSTAFYYIPFRPKIKLFIAIF